MNDMYILVNYDNDTHPNLHVCGAGSAGEMRELMRTLYESRVDYLRSSLRKSGYHEYDVSEKSHIGRYRAAIFYEFTIVRSPEVGEYYEMLRVGDGVALHGLNSNRR